MPSYQPVPNSQSESHNRPNGWANLGLSPRRRWLILGVVSVLIVALWTFNIPRATRFTAPKLQEQHEVTLLVASMKADDTAWLRDYRPEWTKKIYVTDDQSAPLTVPRNKGREAMVYLTYIIDHYDNLTPITIFHHATRFQWHNDDPLYDGQRMLDRLQLKHILASGYVNLRCVWTLGCPAELHPIDEQLETHSKNDRTGSYYAKAFLELFPDKSVPATVGVSCCAQFAATRDKIRERPLEDYKRYREWLLNTELQDHVSGRILEYSWHIIFGEEPVYCPDAKACYCQLYGLCNLTCQNVGVCESQYTLPDYSTMPQGWPEIGWHGETRNITKIYEEQALDYSPV